MKTKCPYCGRQNPSEIHLLRCPIRTKYVQFKMVPNHVAQEKDFISDIKRKNFIDKKKIRFKNTGGVI